jgi:hypothetical protein
MKTKAAVKAMNEWVQILLESEYAKEPIDKIDIKAWHRKIKSKLKKKKK